MRPSIGARTVAKPRSSCAVFSAARADATAAWVLLKLLRAVSKSCRLMTCRCTSCWLRSNWAVAFSSSASLRVSSPRARATAASNGAGSIWNSTCPALTSEPSSNRRASTMPATRARTCATRIGDTRPGRSVVCNTVRACAVTMSTAGATEDPAGGAALPQAASASGITRHSEKKRSLRWIVTARCPRDEAGMMR